MPAQKPRASTVALFGVPFGRPGLPPRFKPLVSRATDFLRLFYPCKQGDSIVSSDGLRINPVPFAQRLQRSFRSLYCCSDGVSGRGASVKYLSHSVSLAVGSIVAPPHHGTEHLGPVGIQFSPMRGSMRRNRMRNLIAGQGLPFETLCIVSCLTAVVVVTGGLAVGRRVFERDPGDLERL